MQAKKTSALDSTMEQTASGIIQIPSFCNDIVSKYLQAAPRMKNKLAHMIHTNRQYLHTLKDWHNYK